jgi:hypothetical protein
MGAKQLEQKKAQEATTQATLAAKKATELAFGRVAPSITPAARAAQAAMSAIKQALQTVKFSKQKIDPAVVKHEILYAKKAIEWAKTNKEKLEQAHVTLVNEAANSYIAALNKKADPSILTKYKSIIEGLIKPKVKLVQSQGMVDALNTSLQASAIRHKPTGQEVSQIYLAAYEMYKKGKTKQADILAASGLAMSRSAMLRPKERDAWVKDITKIVNSTLKVKTDRTLDANAKKANNVLQKISTTITNRLLSSSIMALRKNRKALGKKDYELASSVLSRVQKVNASGRFEEALAMMHAAGTLRNAAVVRAALKKIGLSVQKADFGAAASRSALTIYQKAETGAEFAKASKFLQKTRNFERALLAIRAIKSESALTRAEQARFNKKGIHLFNAKKTYRYLRAARVYLARNQVEKAVKYVRLASKQRLIAVKKAGQRALRIIVSQVSRNERMVARAVKSLDKVIAGLKKTEASFIDSSILGKRATRRAKMDYRTGESNAKAVKAYRKKLEETRAKYLDALKRLREAKENVKDPYFRSMAKKDYKKALADFQKAARQIVKLRKFGDMIISQMASTASIYSRAHKAGKNIAKCRGILSADRRFSKALLEACKGNFGTFSLSWNYGGKAICRTTGEDSASMYLWDGIKTLHNYVGNNLLKGKVVLLMSPKNFLYRSAVSKMYILDASLKGTYRTRQAAYCDIHKGLGLIERQFQVAVDLTLSGKARVDRQFGVLNQNLDALWIAVEAGNSRKITRVKGKCLSKLFNLWNRRQTDYIQAFMKGNSEAMEKMYNSMTEIFNTSKKATSALDHLYRAKDGELRAAMRAPLEKSFRSYWAAMASMSVKALSKHSIFKAAALEQTRLFFADIYGDIRFSRRILGKDYIPLKSAATYSTGNIRESLDLLRSACLGMQTRWFDRTIFFDPTHDPGASVTKRQTAIFSSLKATIGANRTALDNTRLKAAFALEKSKGPGADQARIAKIEKRLLSDKQLQKIWLKVAGLQLRHALKTLPMEKQMSLIKSYNRLLKLKSPDMAASYSLIAMMSSAYQQQRRALFIKQNFDMFLGSLIPGYMTIVQAVRPEETLQGATVAFDILGAVAFASGALRAARAGSIAYQASRVARNIPKMTSMARLKSMPQWIKKLDITKLTKKESYQVAKEILSFERYGVSAGTSAGKAFKIAQLAKNPTEMARLAKLKVMPKWVRSLTSAEIKALTSKGAKKLASEIIESRPGVTSATLKALSPIEALSRQAGVAGLAAGIVYGGFEVYTQRKKGVAWSELLPQITMTVFPAALPGAMGAAKLGLRGARRIRARLNKRVEAAAPEIKIPEWAMPAEPAPVKLSARETLAYIEARNNKLIPNEITPEQFVAILKQAQKEVPGIIESQGTAKTHLDYMDAVDAKKTRATSMQEYMVEQLVAKRAQDAAAAARAKPPPIPKEPPAPVRTKAELAREKELAAKVRAKVSPEAKKAEADALRYLDAKDQGLIPQEVSQEHYFQSLAQAEKTVSKMDSNARAAATSRYLDATSRKRNPSKAKSLAEFLVNEYYAFSNTHREFAIAFPDFNSYIKTMNAYRASGSKTTFTYYIQQQRRRLMDKGIITEYKVAFPVTAPAKPKRVPVRKVPEARPPIAGVRKPAQRERAAIAGEFEAGRKPVEAPPKPAEAAPMPEFVMKPPKYTLTAAEQRTWRANYKKQTQEMIRTAGHEELGNAASTRRSDALHTEDLIKQLKVEAKKYKKAGDKKAYRDTLAQIKQLRKNVRLFEKTANAMEKASRKKWKASQIDLTSEILRNPALGADDLRTFITRRQKAAAKLKKVAEGIRAEARVYKDRFGQTKAYKEMIRRAKNKEADALVMEKSAATLEKAAIRKKLETLYSQFTRTYTQYVFTDLQAFSKALGRYLAKKDQYTSFVNFLESQSTDLVNTGILRTVREPAEVISLTARRMQVSEARTAQRLADSLVSDVRMAVGSQMGARVSQARFNSAAQSLLSRQASTASRLRGAMRAFVSGTPARRPSAIRARAASVFDLSELEFSGLNRSDPAVANAYRNAGRLAVLERFGLDIQNPTATQRTALMNPNYKTEIYSHYIREARRAVYDKLGIQLESLSPHRQQRMGVRYLHDHRPLFDIVTSGNLRDRVAAFLNDASIKNPDLAQISIRRMDGTTGAYMVTIQTPSGRKTIFLKETSMVPDKHAAAMLRSEGIPVPEIDTGSFTNFSGTQSTFGIMSDIRANPNVESAMALHAIQYSRDPALTALIQSNMSAFGESLGYAMEMARILGLQDRHSGNVFVLKMRDGSVKVGFIDLDIVSCYGPENNASTLYSGYLKDQFTALGDAMGTDFSSIQSQVKDSFMRGVERAARRTSTDDFRDFVHSSMSAHDGKPVGWGRSPHAEEISPTTWEKINGIHQQVNTEDGRIILRARDPNNPENSAIASFDEYRGRDPKQFWDEAFALTPMSMGSGLAY